MEKDELLERRRVLWIMVADVSNQSNTEVGPAHLECLRMLDHLKERLRELGAKL